jgi:hypothetical protein
MVGDLGGEYSFEHVVDRRKEKYLRRHGLVAKNTIVHLQLR